MGLSGKRCLHLWAMATYELSGPVASFEENAAKVEELVETMKIDDLGNAQSLPPDEDPYVLDRQDFVAWWKKDVSRLPNLSEVDLGGEGGSGALKALQERATGNDIRETGEPGSPIDRDHSPIGRRYRSPSEMTDSGPATHLPPAVSSVPTEVAGHNDPRAWSHAAPGRPAATRPLNPSRSNKPSSNSLKQGSARIASAKDTLKPVFDPSTLRLPQIRVSSISKPQAKSLQSDAKSARASKIQTPTNVNPADAVTPSIIDIGRETLLSPEQDVKREPQQRQLDPAGIINTVVDCYWITALQILVRLDCWGGRFMKIMDQPGYRDPLVKLIREVATGLLRGTTEEHPTVRHGLFRGSSSHRYGSSAYPADAKVVDHPEQQMDADEFCSNLTQAFDKALPKHDLGSVFDLPIINILRCHRCGHREGMPGETAVHSGVTIYPNNSFTPTDFEQMLCEGLQTGSERQWRCPSKLCRVVGTETVRAVSYVGRLPPVLLVKMSWGLEPMPRGSTDIWTKQMQVQIGPSFDIPLSIALTNTIPHVQEKDTPAQYELRGICCRIGRTSDQGHYVAIIGTGRNWWLMDDHKVTSVLNPSQAAFSEGRYPVMIFYEDPLHEPVRPDEPPLPSTLLRNRNAPDSFSARNPVATKAVNWRAPRLKTSSPATPPVTTATPITTTEVT